MRNPHATRSFPGRDAADAVLATEKARSVQRRDADHLHPREARLVQESELAPVTEARDHPAVAGWIRASQELPTHLDELAFKLHLFR